MVADVAFVPPLNRFSIESCVVCFDEYIADHVDVRKLSVFLRIREEKKLYSFDVTHHDLN